MPLQKPLAAVPRIPRDTAEADAYGWGMVRHCSVAIECFVSPVPVALLWIAAI